MVMCAVAIAPWCRREVFYLYFIENQNEIQDFFISHLYLSEANFTEKYICRQSAAASQRLPLQPPESLSRIRAFGQCAGQIASARAATCRASDTEKHGHIMVT